MMLALVSAAFAGEAGAAAGRTEFTIGGVTVARNGVERPLTRGTELDNGDVVRTNDGRAQIRFTDGAYVSLQPNTDFAIRDYRFENKTDGSERGFFGLVKGAMRTVTGLIGRVNRDRYQIVTPTATVGIRGTGGVIQVLQDGSTLVIGTSGIWSLTNPAGSIDVPAGVSGLSPTDPGEPPSQTTTQPTSGPTPLPPQEPVFVQGNEVDPSGGALIETVVTPLTSGSGYQLATAGSHAAFEGVGVNNQMVTATFDSQGQLTSATGDSFDLTLLPNGSHADFGTDGILAWGRWIGDVQLSSSVTNYSANQGFHYVVGMPTTSMPTSGTATYSLLGATRPTYVNGGLGTLTGSLNVDFGRLTVGMNLDIAMSDGFGYAIGGAANISGSTFSGFSGQGALSVSGTGGACSSGCNALVQGFFGGASAERAGLTYHVDDFIANKDVVGAAAFKKD